MVTIRTGWTPFLPVLPSPLAPFNHSITPSVIQAINQSINRAIVVSPKPPGGPKEVPGRPPRGTPDAPGGPPESPERHPGGAGKPREAPGRPPRSIRQAPGRPRWPTCTSEPVKVPNIAKNKMLSQYF